MSTIIIKYKKNIEDIIRSNSVELTVEMQKRSAELLNKKMGEIIVDYEPFSDLVSPEAPDILVRGETSLSREELLESWANTLMQTLLDSGVLVGKSLRLAVKTFAVKSFWAEKQI